MKKILIISFVALLLITPLVLMIKIECRFYCKDGRHGCLECWGEEVIETEIEETCQVCDGKPYDNPCAKVELGEKCSCNCSKYQYSCPCIINMRDGEWLLENHCFKCRGTGKYLQYTCPECGGDGDNFSWQCDECSSHADCEHCGDDGTVTKTVFVDCEACDDGSQECEACSGTGKQTIWEYIIWRISVS